MRAFLEFYCTMRHNEGIQQVNRVNQSNEPIQMIRLFHNRQFHNDSRMWACLNMILTYS